jgi:hypothetical protein
MRRSIAVLAAVASLAAAPAAVAAPAGTVFPVNGSYKGFTGKHLLSTAQIAGKHLRTFTTNVQRFCSDGSTSWARVVATGLAGEPGAALKALPNGGYRLAITITTKTGAPAKVHATIRKGWMTGTVTYPDLAAIPMGPSVAQAPESAPSAGATCSTQQNASSNQTTFKLHFG